ncbi:MAG: glycosyltransferase [Cyanobacteria bacterium J06623_7]
MMSITVIVPTYRRPQDLEKCLTALKQQTLNPTEILIAVRDSDRQTRSFLQAYPSGHLPIQVVTVTVPGQVAALNACLERVRTDFFAITDDDGRPYPTWLEKITGHFEGDSQVGGVGGRDWMYIGGQLVEGESELVGKVQLCGRTIGRHHLGIGEPREVEILKGANMSYRRAAVGDLRFDTRLLGTGAEVHNDLAFSLSVKKSGWKLIYDPAVEIDHYHGQRFDEDRRGEFNRTAWYNEVYNETLVLLDYLPAWRRVVFAAWTILVGTRKGYGLVQWLRFLPQEGMLAGKKWWLSMQARYQGCLTWWKSDFTPQPVGVTTDKAQPGKVKAVSIEKLSN